MGAPGKVGYRSIRKLSIGNQYGSLVEAADYGGAKADALDDALLDSLPGSSGLVGSEEATRHVNGNALGIYQPLTIATADPVATRATFITW